MTNQPIPIKPTYDNIRYLQKHPDEFAELISDVLNGMNGMRDKKSFVEKMTFGTHRTLQQSFMNLIMAQIKSWAAQKQADNYDARNEATVTAAEIIVEACKDADGFPLI